MGNYDPTMAQMRKGVCVDNRHTGAKGCGAQIRWARPVGCPVYIGVFSREDGLEFETESSGREVIRKLKPGAQLHPCHQQPQYPQGKYIQQYADWLSGKITPQDESQIKRRYSRPRKGKGTPHTREVAPGVESNQPTPPPFKPGEATEARKNAAAPPPLGTAPVQPVPQPTPAVCDECGSTGGHLVTCAQWRPPEQQPKPKPKKKGKKAGEQYAADLLPRKAIEDWKRVDELIQWLRRPFVMQGPPATGKTSYPVRLCESKGWLVVPVTMTPEMPASELLGCQALVNGSFEFQHGALTYAWKESHKRPVILLLNEVENASPDAEVGLHLGLDDVSVAQYRIPSTGETVKPHPWDPANNKGFRVIATTNNELSALSVGVQSRLHITVDCHYPAPGLVDSLRMEEARRLVCAESREWDIRTVMAWDEAVADGCDMRKAAEIVFGKADAKSLLDAITIDAASR